MERSEALAPRKASHEIAPLLSLAAAREEANYGSDASDVDSNSGSADECDDDILRRDVLVLSPLRSTCCS